MINFPNRDEYANFFQGYIDTAGQGDFFEMLDLNTQKVKNTFENIPIEKHNYKYAEGKWTVKELLVHLIDSERIFAYRALVGARGDNSSLLPSFDVNRFIENINVVNRSLSDILGEFYHLRLGNEFFFKSLDGITAAQRANVNGIPTSPRALGYIIIGHCNHHLEVLQEKYLK